jgi:hypothetical protein
MILTLIYLKTVYTGFIFAAILVVSIYQNKLIKENKNPAHERLFAWEGNEYTWVLVNGTNKKLVD